jgi:hypothetical protein
MNLLLFTHNKARNVLRFFLQLDEEGLLDFLFFALILHQIDFISLTLNVLKRFVFASLFAI